MGAVAQPQFDIDEYFDRFTRPAEVSRKPALSGQQLNACIAALDEFATLDARIGDRVLDRLRGKSVAGGTFRQHQHERVVGPAPHEFLEGHAIERQLRIAREIAVRQIQAAPVEQADELIHQSDQGCTGRHRPSFNTKRVSSGTSQPSMVG